MNTLLYVDYTRPNLFRQAKTVDISIVPPLFVTNALPFGHVFWVDAVVISARHFDEKAYNGAEICLIHE
jgi:hypothetical protein